MNFSFGDLAASFKLVHATKALTHLDKSSDNLQMNWYHPNQAANQNNTEMCSSGGRLKLLLYREVCILNPLESHYSSTVLFTALINNNSQSPRVLHCPNLHEVWGASAHVSDRGQSGCVFTNARSTRRMINVALPSNAALQKIPKTNFENARVHLGVHTPHSRLLKYAHLHVRMHTRTPIQTRLFSCCYRHTICK